MESVVFWCGRGGGERKEGVAVSLGFFCSERNTSFFWFSYLLVLRLRFYIFFLACMRTMLCLVRKACTSAHKDEWSAEVCSRVGDAPISLLVMAGLTYSRRTSGAEKRAAAMALLSDFYFFLFPSQREKNIKRFSTRPALRLAGPRKE